MKNFVQKGNVIDYTVPNATTIASGELVQINALMGVAVTSGVAGDVIAVNLEGVYTVPKLTTDVVDQGDRLYYDATNAEVTLSDGSGANEFVGYAFENAGNGTTEVQVKLK